MADNAEVNDRMKNQLIKYASLSICSPPSPLFSSHWAGWGHTDAVCFPVYVCWPVCMYLGSRLLSIDDLSALWFGSTQSHANLLQTWADHGFALVLLGYPANLISLMEDDLVVCMALGSNGRNPSPPLFIHERAKCLWWHQQRTSWAILPLSTTLCVAPHRPYTPYSEQSGS